MRTGSAAVGMCSPSAKLLVTAYVADSRGDKVSSPGDGCCVARSCHEDTCGRLDLHSGMTLKLSAGDIRRKPSSMKLRVIHRRVLPSAIELFGVGRAHLALYTGHGGRADEAPA